MEDHIAAWAAAGLVHETVDGVAWLRMNRPERRNAMDHYPGGNGPNGMGLRDALLAAIHDASEDKTVKVAVITGNGSVFSATVADVARRLATLGPPSAGPTAGSSARDVSARLGHIKGQLNAAWEQSMWQTFREEVALLNQPGGEAPAGGGRPPGRQLRRDGSVTGRATEARGALRVLRAVRRPPRPVSPPTRRPEPQLPSAHR